MNNGQTPKAFKSKAQGRSPWRAHPGKRDQNVPFTPKALHKIQQSSLCNPYGVNDSFRYVHPGCAAGAATLGYGVQPLRGNEPDIVSRFLRLLEESRMRLPVSILLLAIAASFVLSSIASGTGLSPVGTQPHGGLSGKIVFVHGGHGITAANEK